MKIETRARARGNSRETRSTAESRGLIASRSRRDESIVRERRADLASTRFPASLGTTSTCECYELRFFSVTPSNGRSKLDVSTRSSNLVSLLFASRGRRMVQVVGMVVVRERLHAHEEEDLRRAATQPRWTILPGQGHRCGELHRRHVQR